MDGVVALENMEETEMFVDDVMGNNTVIEKKSDETTVDLVTLERTNMSCCICRGGTNLLNIFDGEFISHAESFHTNIEFETGDQKRFDTHLSQKICKSCVPALKICLKQCTLALNTSAQPEESGTTDEVAVYPTLEKTNDKSQITCRMCDRTGIIFNLFKSKLTINGHSLLDTIHIVTGEEVFIDDGLSSVVCSRCLMSFRAYINEMNKLEEPEVSGTTEEVTVYPTLEKTDEKSQIICRMCDRTGIMFNLFKSKLTILGNSLKDCLNFITGEEVFIDDELSSFICSRCLMSFRAYIHELKMLEELEMSGTTEEVTVYPTLEKTDEKSQIICRMCDRTGIMFNLFKSKLTILGNSLKDCLNFITGEEVFIDDELSSFICSRCLMSFRAYIHELKMLEELEMSGTTEEVTVYPTLEKSPITCRMCDSTGIMFNLFKSKLTIRGKSLAETVHIVTGEEVFIDDGHSSFVCSRCLMSFRAYINEMNKMEEPQASETTEKVLVYPTLEKTEEKSQILCRLCDRTGIMFNLFKSKVTIDEKSLPDIFEIVTGDEVFIDDGLSSFICSRCLTSFRAYINEMNKLEELKETTDEIEVYPNLEETDEKLQTICRICKSTSNTINFFNSQITINGYSVPDAIQIVRDEEVFLGDGLSPFICQNCSIFVIYEMEKLEGRGVYVRK